jgi:transcriptional regulator with XRE-family HTH domain
MDVGHRLAGKVKALRAAKGWSQEELADRAGMHRTYISQVERVIKTPSIVAVDRLALALGVSNGELLD